MKALLLTIPIFLSSCTASDRPPPDVERGDYTNGISIIVVNDCEYVAFRDGAAAGGIAHAGNCSNPIHHASFTNHLNRTKGDTLAGPDAIGTASGIKNRLPITRLGGGCGGLAGI